MNAYACRAAFIGSPERATALSRFLAHVNTIAPPYAAYPYQVVAAGMSVYYRYTAFVDSGHEASGAYNGTGAPRAVFYLCTIVRFSPFTNLSMHLRDMFVHRF